MILKAVKILPYLLPTTANVTMGVLNKPTRANIPDRTITIQTNFVENGRYYLQTNNEFSTSYNTYSYYLSETRGTLIGKSVATTEIWAREQEDVIVFGNEYDNPQRQINPRNYTMIKYQVAWASLYINLKNLIIDLGITINDTYTNPQFNFYTVISVLQETTNLKNIYDKNWTENRNTLYNTYEDLKQEIITNGQGYQLEDNRNTLNSNNSLYDDVNHPYPNLDKEIYLRAGEIYYISILTEVQKGSTAVPINHTYWQNKNTVLQRTTLETVIGGESVVNYPLYEVVDLPGLMFTVLTMPFSFISQAFNITLFPDTIYSVNISGIFLSIIALLVFAWIIKLVLRTLK